jgi:hypothetical protein
MMASAFSVKAAFIMAFSASLTIRNALGSFALTTISVIRRARGNLRPSQRTTGTNAVDPLL